MDRRPDMRWNRRPISVESAIWVAPNRHIDALAAGSCASAVILIAAYPIAILDHYRLELGTNRKGKRVKGELGERRIVICAAAGAIATFASIVATRW